jgi:hypothetical protein
VSPRARLLRHAARVALALALALVGVAFLLARPGPLAPRSRSWEDVLAPLGVGLPVGDYELTALRRGEEHDIVLTLRKRSGDRGAIEVHILDRGRWPGIRETKSFGVAYETPRSSAKVEDCEAVTEQIASTVRTNDHGGFEPVDAIPLRAEPDPPAIARALDQITGARGLAIGLCLALATWLLASGPSGGIIAASWLLALGLLLRAPHLDLPFGIRTSSASSRVTFRPSRSSPAKGSPIGIHRSISWSCMSPSSSAKANRWLEPLLSLPVRFWGPCSSGAPGRCAAASTSARWPVLPP